MTEEIKFEKALERLEKIVEDLEAGNIGLDEALKRYEEGIKLVRGCQKTLTTAEKKIEVLTKGLDGSFEKEPFNDEDSSEDEIKVNKKTKKPSAKKQDDDEESLF